MTYGFYIPGAVGLGDIVLSERDRSCSPGAYVIVRRVKDNKHVVFLASGVTLERLY